MQRRGDENAGDADTRQRLEIAGVAQPAGGVDFPALRAARQRRQKREIRPGEGADARQSHGDESRRPELRIVQKRARAEKFIAAKIERENRPRLAREIGRGSPRETFAADDGREIGEPEGSRSRRRIGPRASGRAFGATIDPETDLRKAPRQRLDRRAMIAASLYGVEIGDIDRIESKEPQKSGDDRLRRAAGGERRDDRRIGGALAAKGAHDMAGFQVDDGDDPHGGEL